MKDFCLHGPKFYYCVTNCRLPDKMPIIDLRVLRYHRAIFDVISSLGQKLRVLHATAGSAVATCLGRTFDLYRVRASQ